jgi:hypothetical protein
MGWLVPSNLNILPRAFRVRQGRKSVSFVPAMKKPHRIPGHRHAHLLATLIIFDSGLLLKMWYFHL